MRALFAGAAVVCALIGVYSGVAEAGERGPIGAFFTPGPFGGGDVDVESTVLGQTNRDDYSYDEESGFSLQGYYLHPITDQILIGPRLGLLARNEIDVDVFTGDDELGVELDLRARGEMRLAIAEKVRVQALAELGPYVLFPSDDLKDTAENAGDDDAPRLGFAGGIGGGISYQLTSSLAVRGDLVYEVHGARLINGDDANGSVKATQTGSRLWLLIGVEL